MVCYRCRQPGHVQRYCPAARRCYICGQPGHLAKECYSGNDSGVPQRGRRYPQEALSPSAVGNVVVAAVRSSAALTRGLLDQKEVDMLVDSGSSISLIQESVATAYSRQIERAPKGLELTSAEGKDICFRMYYITLAPGKPTSQSQFCGSTHLNLSSDPGY